MIYEGDVMSDLFIIGNGFDRAHGLKTSYYDFHQFLKDKCKNMENVQQPDAENLLNWYLKIAKIK